MIDPRRFVLALVAVAVPLATACGRSSAAQEHPPVPDLNDGPGPDHPVAMAAAYGVQLLQPPLFDCQAPDPNATSDEFPVPRPPFSPDVFPCSRCHDKPEDFNTTRRTLTLAHQDIKLNHGPHDQWCYDCHNPTDRDQLRLASGRLVPFERSYELCGQCHSTKLRDWRLGIHGRRVGCWNGQRQYLLCVHCHNQHEPKFAPRKPLPRPFTPGEIRAGRFLEGTP